MKSLNSEIKLKIVFIIIIAIILLSSLYWWNGIKSHWWLSILYLIIILSLIIPLCLEIERGKISGYFSLIIAVLAFISPVIVQEDTNIKIIQSTNVYNCNFAVSRTKDILSQIDSGHYNQFQTRFMVDPYISHIDRLMISDSSTTVSLLNSLQNQNELISRIIAINSDSFELLGDSNMLKKADIQEQEINGLYSFFLQDVKTIVHKIKTLESTIVGDNLESCQLPDIPKNLCTKSIYVKFCRDIY